MDNIAIAAATKIRSVEMPRKRHPGMNLGATLAAISRFMGDVHKMAYVDPYTHHRHQSKTGPGDDLEGRDPAW